MFATLFCSVGAEEEAAVAASTEAAAEGEEVNASDETQAIIKQLTISMASEVVDGRTFIVRDTAAKTGRKKLLVRLGNVALPEQYSMSDEDHKAKLEKSYTALVQLVEKQMIWWKAAADEHQPPVPEGGKPEDVPMIADVWLMDGRHINGMLQGRGHLTELKEYEEELARNILTAEADEKKKESYKELEMAMKDSEKERKKQAKEAAKQAVLNEPGEPLGLAGWLGITVLIITVLGAAFNFGRESSKKKVNYNKKSGFAGFWSKLKGN